MPKIGYRAWYHNTSSWTNKNSQYHRYDFKGVKFGSSEGFLGGVHCAARASGQTWRVRLSIAHAPQADLFLFFNNCHFLPNLVIHNTSIASNKVLNTSRSTQQESKMLLETDYNCKLGQNISKIWQNNPKSPNAPMCRTIARPSDGPASIHNTYIASNKGLSTSQSTKQVSKMLRK